MFSVVQNNVANLKWYTIIVFVHYCPPVSLCTYTTDHQYHYVRTIQ